MRRYLLRATVFAALALGAAPAQANNPECLGASCGRPSQDGGSLWGDLLRWLGLS